MNGGILTAFIVVLVGIYGLVNSKNIIKSIICFNIADAGAILLFLSFAYHPQAESPILIISETLMVDPLPQALMITAIVIGASITALALIISIKLFHYYGTLEWKEVISIRQQAEREE
jgi:multicomponent Na+:H+ antiporter subunit C